MKHAFIQLVLFAVCVGVFGVEGRADIIKQVMTADGACAVSVNTRANFMAGLVLVGSNGREELLSLKNLTRHSFERFPLSFDYVEGRLYYVSANEGGPSPTFEMRSYLLDDLRTANYSASKGAQRKFKDMYYDKRGILRMRQVTVPPLDRAVHFAELVPKTPANVFWDVHALHGGDVRLYILSARKLEIWRAPEGNWRAGPRIGEGWTHRATHNVNIDEQFIILKDTDRDVVLATAGGQVITVDNTGAQSVDSFDKIPASRKVVILNRIDHQTILTSHARLTQGAQDVTVFGRQKVRTESLSKELVSKLRRTLILQEQISHRSGAVD